MRQTPAELIDIIKTHLTPHQIDVVSLFWFDGFSERAIAQQQGKSAVAIHRTIHRALKRLARLARLGIGPILPPRQRRRIVKLQQLSVCPI